MLQILQNYYYFEAMDSEECYSVVNMFVYRCGFFIYLILCGFFFFFLATSSSAVMRHSMVSLTAVLKVLFLNRCLKAGPKHGMDQCPSLNRCHSLT